MTDLKVSYDGDPLVVFGSEEIRVDIDKLRKAVDEESLGREFNKSVLEERKFEDRIRSHWKARAILDRIPEELQAAVVNFKSEGGKRVVEALIPIVKDSIYPGLRRARMTDLDAEVLASLKSQLADVKIPGVALEVVMQEDVYTGYSCIDFISIPYKKYFLSAKIHV